MSCPRVAFAKIVEPIDRRHPACVGFIEHVVGRIDSNDGHCAQ